MSKSMIYRLKATIIVLSWFCLGLASAASAQQGGDSLTISDIRLSNFGGNNFVVSWRTSIPTQVNELLLGLAPDKLTIVRGDMLDSPGRLHYVQVLGSDIAYLDSTYYYKVRSGGLEGAAGSAGYDSIISRQQAFPQTGATIQGYVAHERTAQPVENAIVRAYLTWSRTVSGVTQSDSSMWYAVVTNAEGKYNFGLPNFRKYNGAAVVYVPGSTWLHLEIMGEAGNLAPDSTLLPFVQNSISEFTILDTLEIAGLTLPGDLDGSGNLNIFDLLDMLKLLSGKIIPDAWQVATADMDRNGKVDVFDLLNLLIKIKTTGALNS